MPSSTGVTVTLNITENVEYDPWNMLDNVNKRLIVPVSGYYNVDAVTYWQGYNNGSRWMGVRRSDGSIMAQRAIAGTASDGSSVLMPLHGMGWLAAGMSVQLQAYQNAGTTLNLLGNRACMLQLELAGVY